MNNTPEQLDATLAAIALVKAFINVDKPGVDAVLAKQADHTAILNALLFMFEDVLNKVSGGHPHAVLDGLRARVVARIAESDAEDDES